MAERYFEVTLKRGWAGKPIDKVKTLLGMGLGRTNKTVYLKDTPAIRGMIYKVVQLVDVTPKSGTKPQSMREKTKAQGRKKSSSQTRA